MRRKGSGMPGRPWTPEEDEAIRRAAAANMRHGLSAANAPDRTRNRFGPAARLRELAAEIGRSYAAVRKRAERIGAASYRRDGGA